MSRLIVGALVGCVVTSAVGGFGAPVLCAGSDKDCPARWQQAAAGALAAGGTLGTLLAKLNGDGQP